MNSLKRFFGAGGKTGGQVRTPYEAKNTLQSRAYIRFVDLLSEGPIEGFCNSKGVTLQDARLFAGCQPDVTASNTLWYDPAKFDVEFENGNSGPFTVYAKMDTEDVTLNTQLFSISSGYPFSGSNGESLPTSITASFKEVVDAVSNELTSANIKDNADVFLLTYPRTSLEQTQTERTITKTTHGFGLGDIIYRKRTAVNTYSWEKKPDGLSPFLFQTRIVTSIPNANTVVASVYPICEEGRARALYFKSQGSNYLPSVPVVNPIVQANHLFTVGALIDFIDDEWIRVDRYSQTVATVTKVIDEDTFTIIRQVFDGPQINVPSVVSTAVFFDDTPLADENTLAYNFANVRMDYRLGDEVQEPLRGYEQTETLLDTTQSVEIRHQVDLPNTAAVIKTLPIGDWDELIINLLLPDGLYRQDTTNGDVFGLGDNYGTNGAPSSSASIPENQPPVIRITYRIVKFINGQEHIDGSQPELPFGGNDGYVVIRGKTMSPYEISVRGSLNSLGLSSTGGHAYRLYFYRVTPDDAQYTSGASARRSRVTVNSITGIVNVRMSYPYCALVGIEIDAEQFSQVPSRGYQVKLLKLQVPTNYFPPFSKRVRTIRGTTYTDFRTVAEYNRLPGGEGVYDEAGGPVTQIWDGTFYDSWTDNPAWIVFNLATNTRFGFGQYINLANKWLFYKIARYCDELIPTTWDGVKFTSKEPRFACSCYFQTFADAWQVLSDISSSFAGYVFYQSGSLIPVQDCPRPARFAFTPGNVENGFFTYTGIHKNGRNSSIVAKFTDPANRFRLTPVVVQDESLIAQLGWKPLEKTAFGVTSKFQAERFARRLLVSSKELTTTVKFTTGLLGSVLRPGDVIEVLDPTRSSLPFGGRITDIQQASPESGAIVILDRYLSPEQLQTTDNNLFSTYGLVCQLPTGVPTPDEIADETLLAAYMAKQISEPLKVSSVSRAPNGYTMLTLADPLPAGVEIGFVWALRRVDVQPQLFQVLTVEETTKHKFGIVALEYSAGLYDTVDYDSTYTENQINPDLLAWKRPYPVRNLQIQAWPRITDDGTKVYQITISWSPPAQGFAKAYLVEWRRGLGDYQELTTTKLTTAETIVVEADSYCVRVSTVGLRDVRSAPVEMCTLIGVANITNAEVISGLEILGQANNTLFTTSDVSFDWRVNWSEATSGFQTDVPPILPPSVSDYEVLLYSTTMVQLFATSRRETNYTLSLDQNRGLPSGPHREFILGIRARTHNGALSKQTLLRVRNERPVVPVFTFEADNNGYLLIKFNPQLYADFDHFNVWVSDTNNFTPSDANLVFAGSSTAASFAIEIGVPSYFRVAALDQLASSTLDCNISDQFSVVGIRSGNLTAFDFLNPSWGG